MTDKEKFEYWMSDGNKWPLVLSENSEGEYLYVQAREYWGVWQAAVRSVRDENQ